MLCLGKKPQKAKTNKKQVNCFMIKYLLLSSYPLYQAFEATLNKTPVIFQFTHGLNFMKWRLCQVCKSYN